MDMGMGDGDGDSEEELSSATSSLAINRERRRSSEHGGRSRWFTFTLFLWELFVDIWKMASGNTHAATVTAMSRSTLSIAMAVIVARIAVPTIQLLREKGRAGIVSVYQYKDQDLRSSSANAGNNEY